MVSVLQTMPVPVGVALGALGIALVLLGLRDGWVALRYRLRRPVRIGDVDADAGRVVVSGIARRADDVIEAPLSGRECLVYAWRSVELRTMRRFDGAIDTWGQRGPADRDGVPFYVEDETGRVLVDPADAELRLAEEWVRDPAAVVPDVQREGTVRATVEDLLGIRTHEHRYYESRLDDGETVTVRGRVAATDGADDRRSDVDGVVRGTVLADATPTAAAGRTLRQAAISVAVGLFVIVAVGAFLVLPSVA
ncbi:MAG: hypothetical protein ABEH35_00150 [Haloarculaceae archaeon]